MKITEAAEIRGQQEQFMNSRDHYHFPHQSFSHLPAFVGQRKMMYSDTI